MQRLLFLDTGRRRRQQALKLAAAVLGTFAIVAVMFFGLGYLITKH